MAFESSPYYMFHPLAADRISRDLPGVKLLVLLRDPVERAYSGHAHEMSMGFETEPFERALELEDARLEGEAERIHVVDSDAFFTDPGPVYNDILQFLGLPRRGPPAFKRRNARARAPMTGETRSALEEHYRPHDERLATWLGHQPSWRA